MHGQYAGGGAAEGGINYLFVLKVCIYFFLTVNSARVKIDAPEARMWLGLVNIAIFCLFLQNIAQNSLPKWVG